MPTIKQTNRLQNMRDFFNDDDRIGHGGFESPSGRQWWEPERNPVPARVISRPVSRKLESFTDSDDQDWLDHVKRMSY